jgi:gamma-glutamylcyclotransferase (GGCT)/AIG2-like uncharacterized protein YtfP
MRPRSIGPFDASIVVWLWSLRAARRGVRWCLTAFLFAYGTLMPVDLEQAGREGWVKDAVRGLLYDLGPYPALVDVDDSEAEWVSGWVREVTTVELEGPLDAYEGVAEGLYRRVRAMTRGGRWAWVYVYNRDVPPGAAGPLLRWKSLTPKPLRFRRDRSSEKETDDVE